MLESWRFWGALGFAWLLSPLGMVLVGWVLESRWVPWWRDQARAFIPGDFLLGIVFAVGYYLTPQVELASWWRSLEFAGLTFMGAIGLFCLMRYKLDGPKYPPGALKTPTKRYHDYALYVGYAWVLLFVCVPAILTVALRGPANFGVTFVAFAALTIWVVMLVLDETNPDVPSSRAHAYSYNPIWRGLPRLRQRMGWRW